MLVVETIAKIRRAYCGGRGEQRRQQLPRIDSGGVLDGVARVAAVSPVSGETAAWDRGHGRASLQADREAKR
ncbi:MAG TPA: hypothetical protein PLD10_00870 [Rhodopila sp.]|nr:hypothetical protein [Rhodopila sp.]